VGETQEQLPISNDITCGVREKIRNIADLEACEICCEHVEFDKRMMKKVMIFWNVLFVIEKETSTITDN
jgi:hypothetical protein